MKYPMYTPIRTIPPTTRANTRIINVLAKNNINTPSIVATAPLMIGIPMLDTEKRSFSRLPPAQLAHAQLISEL